MKENRNSNSKSDYQLVYTIVKRRDGRKVWVRIGAAFRNRDGSLNVKLDAVPTNGELQIRDRDRDELERPKSGFSSDDFQVPKRLAS